MMIAAAGLSPALGEVVSAPRPSSIAEGTGGAVASPHPLATEAGLQVLRDGGNAIDAAIATSLAWDRYSESECSKAAAPALTSETPSLNHAFWDATYVALTWCVS